MNTNTALKSPSEDRNLSLREIIDVARGRIKIRLSSTIRISNKK